MADLIKARQLAEQVRLSEDRPQDGSQNPQDYLGREQHRDSMLRHGVLISEQMTPDIEARLTEVCDRLRVPRSSISAFVYSSSEIQADCLMDTPSTCVLRFTSGLVNLMDSEEFKFVAAHEIGHFLLGHGACNQYQGEGSTESYMHHRSKELSADRVGLLGSESLDQSIQAIIKTASGLSEKVIRFDISKFLSQSELLSNPSRGESHNSTHPSMLIRCRALIWFGMEIKDMGGLSSMSVEAKQKIDRRVVKDLERFVDGQSRAQKKEIEDDILLWKLCVLIVAEGSFQKDLQDRIKKSLGEQLVDQVKNFFSLFPADELMNESVKRLEEVLNQLMKNFPSDAQLIENRAFESAYSLVNQRT